MIADLKPYPAMKDSGVEWLGAVPEHWDVRRLGTSVHGCINGIWGNDPNGREDLPCVRVADFDRVRLRVRLAKPTLRAIAPGERNRRLLKKSDLLLEKSGGGDLQPVGVVMLYDHDVEAVCSNFVARMPVSAHCDSSYLTYLHSHLYAIRLNVRSIKQTTGIQNLDSSSYLGEPVAFPPLPEQSAIVRYLDHADRRIRRYIRAKQKLVKLLEEQKHALIHQAVTGQVDVRTGQPYPAYKPSGVEWLGDVPKHWKILPLKWWVSTKITDGPHETPALLDDGIPFMSAESMVGGRLDFSRRRGFISREQHEIYCRKCRPRRDDIFMCKSGATTGKVAIVETADEFSVWSPLALIRVESHKVLARLLFAVLQTRYVQRQVQDTWSYGTQPNLAMRAMERLVVVLPPIDEQQEVLAHLDQTTKKPSEAIDRAHREISLLREYRTRLIADVVTGKLDVRKAAVRLSDEVEEPEPLDQANTLIGGEEEPTDELDTTPEEAAV